MFTLAHLSDLHVTRPRAGRAADFVGKRTLGWLSWGVRRRREHRPGVVAALIEDLRAEKPDHVAITGDLTHLGLDSEIREAREWLERLGDPGWISLVQGNHDAYASGALEASRRAWRSYLQGSTEESARESGAADATAPSSSHSDLRADLRSDARSSGLGDGDLPGSGVPVWIHGPVAVVGMCSAVPTPVPLASGRVGEGQCRALESALAELGDRGLYRVVLIHHPPHAHAVSPRRALSDGARLRSLLARVGAELVLHGHTHRGSVAWLPGPRGEIPVVGVASASAVGLRGAERRARYNLYRIAGGPGSWELDVEVRVLAPDAAAFVPERSFLLATP